MHKRKPRSAKHHVKELMRQGVNQTIKTIADDRGMTRLDALVSILRPLLESGERDDLMAFVAIADKFKEPEVRESNINVSGDVAHTHAAIPLSDSLAAIAQAAGSGEESTPTRPH